MSFYSRKFIFYGKYTLCISLIIKWAVVLTTFYNLFTTLKLDIIQKRRIFASLNQ